MGKHPVYFQKSNVVIAIPDDAIINGSCTSGRIETLQVFFFTNNIWAFTINIKSNEDTRKSHWIMANKDITYAWEYVVLTYYIDSHFPDARDVSGK